MPDVRKHRGAHPQDSSLFADDQLVALRLAVAEYSWLLSRGYAEASSLKLVGDRYELISRQRTAVMRCSCADSARERRQAKCRERLDSTRVGIDGYNLLITIESALAGGVVLVGRDGCYRDLASMHGTYRKVEETIPAVRMIDKELGAADVDHVDLYLDQPVSNSGRLKALIAEELESCGLHWNIQLLPNPDTVLAAYDGTVVSSDSWILDRCSQWVNLAAQIIKTHVPDGWVLDLG